MTGEQTENFPAHTGDEILQFAPNFSVYVLPSDVLCLYSEDRKYLLHGKLYCALGAAIAEDGKSIPELVSELEQDYPREHIFEALKRLLDRRYAVAKPRSLNGPVAAYWASMGLTPQDAEKNLQDCRIRVQ